MSSPADNTPARGTEEEFLLLKDQKISEEDRKEILETIDKIVAENKISVTPELFSLKPQRNGLVFPLIINSAAVVAVIAGFFLVNLVFARQQNDISNQAGTFFSAEGKLIDEVRKQSQAALAAKDQQIQQEQTALTSLDQQAQDLKNNMNSTIAAKEDELQTQMQSQLAAEKARLQKLGISEDEVNRRLAAYQAQANDQFNQQLAAYRNQSQQQLAAEEAKIQQQEDQSRQQLAQANQQRDQLQSDAQNREVQMRSQFESERQQLQSQASQAQSAASQAQSQASQAQNAATAAQQQLQSLAAQNQNEQLLSDQVVGSYNSILQDIQQYKFTQAQTDMDALRNLLQSPKIDTLPELAKRRPVDLAILGSLSDLIKVRIQAQGQTAQTIDPAVQLAANQLIASQAIVAKADSAAAGGDPKTANDLYTQALNQVPLIAKAFGAVNGYNADNTKQLLAQRDTVIQGLKDDATKQAQTLAQATQSLADSKTTITTLQQKISDQSQEIDAMGKTAGSSGSSLSQLQVQLAQQQQLAAQYKSQLDTANASTTDLKAQLADNQAKLAKLQAGVAAAQSGTGTQPPTPGAVASTTPGGMYGPDDLKTAIQKAHDSALNNVLLLTNYLDNQSGVPNPALAKQIQDIASQDSLFNEAATDIQSLATRGTRIAPVMQVPKLIGTVSFVASNQLTIERLVSMQIGQGAAVVIRRKDTQGIETTIAQGVVSSVTADSVVVTVQSAPSGAPTPTALDLAYLTPSSGS